MKFNLVNDFSKLYHGWDIFEEIPTWLRFRYQDKTQEVYVALLRTVVWPRPFTK